MRLLFTILTSFLILNQSALSQGRDNTPAISVDPDVLQFEAVHAENDTSILVIKNLGDEMLEWELNDRESVLLSAAEFQQPASPPLESGADIEFILDDGTLDATTGLISGGQFLWLNRFTPDTNLFPLSIDEIHIFFNGEGGVDVGDLVDIYLYEDRDGDGNPGTGANWKASIHDVAVRFADGLVWSEYSIDPVLFGGDGDILVAVVNRTAGIAPGEKPAAIDETQSQQRSWLGTYFSAPPDPPTFPAENEWGLLSAFGFDGNWMLRAAGESFANCPWLHQSAQAGKLAPGDSIEIEVIAESDDLGFGEHHCEIVLDSNDPDNSQLVIPVSFTVLEPGEPNVSVEPAGFFVQVEMGHIGTEELTISNYGDATLHWSLYDALPDEQSPLNSPANLISFDEIAQPCTFNTIQAIRDDYIDMGIRFRGDSPRNGGGIIDECVEFHITGHSAPNFLAFDVNTSFWDGGSPRPPQSIMFDEPIYSLAINAASGIDPGYEVSLSAFNAQDELVDETSLTLTPAMQTLSVEGNGIDSVYIWTETPTLALDDLSWSEISYEDCEWLTPHITEGSILPGESAVVELTIDASILDLGNYHCNIFVTSAVSIKFSCVLGFEHYGILEIV